MIYIHDSTDVYYYYYRMALFLPAHSNDILYYIRFDVIIIIIFKLILFNYTGRTLILYNNYFEIQER